MASRTPDLKVGSTGLDLVRRGDLIDRRRLTAAILLFLPLCQLRHGHDLIAFFDADQAHALRGTADGADVARDHAQDLALLADQHQLVIVVHVRDADDLAVAIAGLDVDDADAAA